MRHGRIGREGREVDKGRDMMVRDGPSRSSTCTVAYVAGHPPHPAALSPLQPLHREMESEKQRIERILDAVDTERRRTSDSRDMMVYEVVVEEVRKLQKLAGQVLARDEMANRIIGEEARKIATEALTREDRFSRAASRAGRVSRDEALATAPTTAPATAPAACDPILSRMRADSL